MLGVSRPTVREALIALEVEGRLRIRVGSGIYVNAQPPSEAGSAPAPIEGPFEVLRARAFVESAVAEEAARRATPEDVARLDSILAEVGGRAAQHRALGGAGPQLPPRRGRDARQRRAAAHGRRAVRPAHQPLFRAARAALENDSTWRAAHVEHVAIRNAIAAHHPARARDAMREHLERSHRRFSRDFGEYAVRSRRQRGQLTSTVAALAARQGHQSVQDTQRAAQSGRLLAIDPGLVSRRKSGGRGMARTKLTRRQFVATTAAASATAIAAPFVRTAHAAGKLTIGFWDHWVPGANNASEALVKEWAAKEKVEVQIDYITSQGNKNLLTIAAEAQAKSGHDIFAMPDLVAARPGEEPGAGRRHHGGADQAERRGQRHRRIPRHAPAGTGWRFPPDVGSQIKGPCSRIDLLKQHAGIDVLAMYPAGSAPKADAGRWTLCSRRQKPARRPASRSASASASTEDNVDTAGAILPVLRRRARRREGQDHGQVGPGPQGARILREARGKFLPPDAPAWDDASNNKWLVSGKGALIMNPPSAWAVAKRDAPQVAEQLWTHGFPAGAERPLRAVPALLLGHLELRQEQDGGQETCLCTCRSRRRSRSWWRRAAATTCRPSRS